jgi:YD repeat-containing protein
VAGATYGNGQVFSQTLTARQQTDRLRSVKGAELPVDLTYAYTARSQIASINDQTVANIDQTFTYDGIGRLTASTGPWGNGTFQYDGLGNLRKTVCPTCPAEAARPSMRARVARWASRASCKEDEPWERIHKFLSESMLQSCAMLLRLQSLGVTVRFDTSAKSMRLNPVCGN